MTKKIRFSAFLVILGIILPQMASADFRDVKPDYKYYNAIVSLQEQGVLKGYDDGTFKPDDLIQRAELIKMIFTHIGYKSHNNTNTTNFTDVPPESWFASYVKKALELGVININPNVPLFYPAGPITKIEALKLIMPLEGVPAPYINEKSPIYFKDISDASGYAYLVRAGQKSGLLLIDDGNMLYPFKNLTRGEAAEFLIRAQDYRESGYTGSFVSIYDYSGAELDIVNNPKFPIFVDIWNKINDSYIDNDRIDKDQLVYGAIDGMVNILGDEYSVFEQPEDAGALENSLEGSFEGIGTVLDTLDDNFIIMSVLKDSPASRAGLQSGDFIKKVNGTDLSGLTMDEVIELIKGPAGTKVTLTVLRGNSTLTFEIIREKLTLDTVIQENISSTLIPSDIAYISIYQFTSGTPDEFDTSLKEALTKNPRGLILDLRDNPGGYLDSAYKVLFHFLKSGKTLINLEINNTVITEKSTGEGEFINAEIPLIILVNDGTASAAEVVAGAIQDHKIGKLIGEQTYGKGTVQEVTTYSDHSLLKLSIAHWLTPLGNDINHIGLTPDIAVSVTAESIANNTDIQLQKAIDEINKL
jgi:carboxyl-terminal processing protease